MKVSEIRKKIEGLNDDVEIFAPWFSEGRANLYIEDNLCNTYKETADLTLEEWNRVVNCMTHDDAIYNELYDSFTYFIQEIIKERVKNESVTNKVNSKKSTR